jgi:SAM-dependent methyltransferase
MTDTRGKTVQTVSAQLAYDHLADGYDGAYGNPLARAENALAFALVRRAGCDRGRILDLGCGTALFLEYTPVAPERYVGVDISAGMLRVARRKFPHHTFCQADMADLSALPDRSFDSIVSLFASFAYALEPHRVVAEIERLLAPGGRFLVMTLGARHRDRTPLTVEALNMSVPWRLWHAADLRRQFARFRDVRVSGTHALADCWLASAGAEAAYGWLAAEAATLGRALPERCRYLVVTGGAQ